jgi:hypothetical protein
MARARRAMCESAFKVQKAAVICNIMPFSLRKKKTGIVRELATSSEWMSKLFLKSMWWKNTEVWRG